MMSAVDNFSYYHYHDINIELIHIPTSGMNSNKIMQYYRNSINLNSSFYSINYFHCKIVKIFTIYIILTQETWNI